jgi:SNF2 family DNA or RNA helicase
MTTVSWQIQGAHLGVFRDGVMAWPEAEVVYAVFVDGESYPDLPPRLERIAGQLTFSAYPLVLRIVLTATDGRPHTELIGEAGAVSESLPISAFDHDHVIVGDTWHPLDTHSRDEAAAVLGPRRVLGPVRSLAGYLDLLRASSDGIVDDNIRPGDVDPSSFAPSAPPCPLGVRATLYPYQHDGWRWLRFCSAERLGGLLGDEMGLGKTLQIISLFSDPGPTGLVCPALVVAPGSLLENWRRELHKFAPHLQVLKHHGPQRTGRPAELAANDVVLTSYETVVRDGGLFGMIEWPVVVLDEAQFIRNPDADRTRSVKRLRRKVAFAVTGTPVENRLLDLWSIMDFVVPGHLGDRKSFEKHYPDDVAGAAAVERLITPLMLRRRIATVATDLPARIDIPQAIELSEREVAEYESIRTKTLQDYGTAASLVSIGRLRQFCADPSLVGINLGLSSKVVRFDEIVAEIFERGQKVIIFTSFTEMADLLARRVEEQFKAFARTLDGRLPIDARVPLISEFSVVQGAAALILNPRAGGTGLNITAANHVIHFNPEWNPALEDQASARAHRRGQDLPVTIHRLFCVGTVEEVVSDRLDKKRQMAGAAVVGIAGADDDYEDLIRAMTISPVTAGVQA